MTLSKNIAHCVFSSIIVNNVAVVNSSGSKSQLTVGPFLLLALEYLGICIFF